MREEIILNLWYVCDKDGNIYSIRAQAYIRAGTDQEKLAYLQKQAYLDYMDAQVFELPTRSDISVQVVFHEQLLPVLGGPLYLFEDAIQELERSMQNTTRLKIPKDPLVCITPLLVDKNNNIYPRVDQVRRF